MSLSTMSTQLEDRTASISFAMKLEDGLYDLRNEGLFIYVHNCRQMSNGLLINLTCSSYINTKGEKICLVEDDECACEPVSVPTTHRGSIICPCCGSQTKPWTMIKKTEFGSFLINNSGVSAVPMKMPERTLDHPNYPLAMSRSNAGILINSIRSCLA